MSKPRQTQHFAEIEYCLQNYFNSQLAPVMKEAQTYLTQKQVEEIGAYHASTAGVLRSLANGANGICRTTPCRISGRPASGTARQQRIMWQCAGNG